MAAQHVVQRRDGQIDKRAMLRAHPFLKDLNKEIVDKLTPRAVTRSARKGTVLFRKGDVGSRLYIVCSGIVRISAPSEEGKDTIFNLIVPNEIFGEIAFLDGGERTADATMIEDGELLVIERRDVIHLLHEYPDLAAKLIGVLCQRIRATSQQVEDFVFLDAETRLAKVLLHLYRRSFLSPQQNVIRITQRELSQMVGISRESVNKQLRQWQQRKYLTLERGGVVILSPKRLEEFVAHGAE